MSHWHFTTAELALLTPLGVIVGACASYAGARKAASTGLASQRLAVEAARDEAEANRRAELAREQRDHRRAAYVELGGELQLIDENLHYLIPPLLETSMAPQADWSSENDSFKLWTTFYVAILDALPACQRNASVYGSAEIRIAVRAIGQLSRALAPPQKFTSGPGHYIYAIEESDNGIGLSPQDCADGNDLRIRALANVRG